MSQKILAVVGPTASGKTAFSVALAQYLQTEVVSCDSMQIYRGMETGTAAPTHDEMCGISHHMLGVISPEMPFSCAEYAEMATEFLNQISAKGKIPILCGGTGLYLDALLYISDFSESEKSEELRRSMQTYADEHGNEALHARLAAVDPDAAAGIHPNNVRRVIRALEIYETTGISKTEWDRRSTKREPRWDAEILFLNFRSRERLYDRIDRRVDSMMENGLLSEARALWKNGMLNEDCIAAQAIGYKEFLPYFRGEVELSAVRDAICQASRRYAKRQMTWFRRYENAICLYPDDAGDDQPLATADELVCQAVELLRKRNFL